MQSTVHSARGPAIGYLYQVPYALYMLLTASTEEAEISIETLDDMVIELDNTSELCQLKHSVNATASLTDASRDLWRTLRVWSAHLAEGRSIENTVLTLITTATVTNNRDSVAWQLKQPSLSRDNGRICEQLTGVANSSRSESLAACFQAFLSLTSEQRIQLVKSMRIIDESPQILEVATLIKSCLIAVRPTHRDAVYDRLASWWTERVYRHLNSDGSDKIARHELLMRIADIADQFKPDALPIDFLDREPDKIDVAGDQRMFVLQLREIALKNKQIENAIRDYYRAVEQRSKWIRESLVDISELKTYEKKLIDAWERELLWQNYDVGNDDSVLQAGRCLYRWAEMADLPIRERVTEPYIMRGSFHILANENQPRVWWHPLFIQRLQELLPGTAAPNDNYSEIHTSEVARLLNPAFCSLLLQTSIYSYENIDERGMPYSLLFLVLPLVLHQSTRQLLPKKSTSKMHLWLQNNPSVRIGFANRVSQLVPITKEALRFSLAKRLAIAVRDTDRFSSVGVPRQFPFRSGALSTSSQEIKSIQRKSAMVGKWFARSGKPATIYIHWGISP